MKHCPQCETGYPDSLADCPTHGVPMNEIRDLKPGMVVHHSYRIVRKLGEGGMGAVYLAQHTLMEEPRALKFLSPELSRDQAFTARFLREVRALRQIRNRNVVECGDLEAAEDGTLFFSMEFVEGPNLRDFLRGAAKPLDVPQALAIAHSIAAGLGAAHSKGIVHRDIKPENILMAREGSGWVPKVADFGIVATKESSAACTRTASALLTVTYAAPEQWRGTPAAELDGRTDLYAFGGVLYEMLAGQPVFKAQNYEGWAEQHRSAVPQPPSKLRPELANWRGLDALVLRLLAKDREQRPKDVAELLGLIEAVAYAAPTACQAAEPAPRLATTWENPGSSERKNERKPRGRAPVWVWAASAALLVLAAFAARRIYAPSKPPLPARASQTQPVGPRPVANTNPEASNPIPGAAQEPRAANAALLVTCDLACNWKLDGETKGRIEANGTAKAKAEPGQHVLAAATEDGADQVKRVIEAKANAQTVATIELKPVRDARLRAEQDLNTTTLLVLCDLACNWKLDGETKGRIEANTSDKTKVEPGQHVVVATTKDGADQVKRVIEAKANAQTVVTIELKPVRDARFKADQKARDKADGEARDKALHEQQEREQRQRDEAAHTWIDPATGLMWEKKDNSSDVTWNQAFGYCRNLRLAGRTGWRLATIDELQGIYDTNAHGHKAKGGLQLSGMGEWSSSPGGLRNQAWAFDFTAGRRRSGILNLRAGKRALCVRRPGD